MYGYILPFLRNNYVYLLAAAILAATLLVSVVFIKKIIRLFKSKVNLINKILSLVIYLFFWFVSLVFAALIIYFANTDVQGYIYKCQEHKKTFTYDTCSIEYTEFDNDGTCIPGGVRMFPPPETTMGFETNRQIDILNCLCSKNKLQSAFTFRNKYLQPSTADKAENACKNIPGKIFYL